MAKISSGESSTQLKGVTQQVTQVRQQATRLTQSRGRRSAALRVGFQRSVENLGSQVERYRQQVPQLARQEQDRLNRMVAETHRAVLMSQESAAKSAQASLPLSALVGGAAAPPSQPSQGGKDLQAQLAAVQAELQALREELTRFEQERKALEEEVRRLEDQLERMDNRAEPQNWALFNTALAYTKLLLQITLQEIQRLELEIHYLETEEEWIIQCGRDLSDFHDKEAQAASSPGGIARTYVAPSSRTGRTMNATAKPSMFGHPASSNGKLT